MTHEPFMSLEPFASLLLYQMAMSLLSVGGMITLASEQHRTMVVEHGWLSDAQFQASITLAQVAPGPNVLFLALWGWHIGLNAAQAAGPAPWQPWLAAALGLVLGLVGGLAPSSVLAVLANRWSRRHAQRHGVKALRLGLAPIVVGAMGATAYTLVKATSAGSPVPSAFDAVPWVVAGICALLMWRTRLHLLVLLAGGAVVGVAHQLWI